MFNQTNLTNFIGNKKINLQTLIVIASSLALFCFAFAALCFGISSIKSSDKNNTTSIAVSGEGEMAIIPDVAIINATIKQFSPLVYDAQNLINAKNKAIESALGQYGIDGKDIRSTSYSTKPKYALREEGEECQTAPCKSKYKIIGYEAIQSIQIKAHKVGSAGEIVNELTKLGIGEVSGPNFAVDDDEKFKSQARAVAIQNAKNKAKGIAKNLDSKLGKVIKFEEEAVSANNSQGSEEEVVKAKVNITYSLE